MSKDLCVQSLSFRVITDTRKSVEEIVKVKVVRISLKTGIDNFRFARPPIQDRVRYCGPTIELRQISS